MLGQARFFFPPQSALISRLDPLEPKLTARCELSLIVDIGAQPAPRLSEILAGLLAAAPIASVTFKYPDAGAASPSSIKQLVEITQRASTAALIADDPALARIVKADGVHVSWSKNPAATYRAARDDLGARLIVGVDAGRSRDDAMTLGEAGCDYVAFGIPSHVADRETAEARQIELIEWWSEIFEVPCVAFDVDDAGQAARLADAGADFLAIALDVEAAESDPAAWLAPFAQAAADAGKVT